MKLSVAENLPDEVLCKILQYSSVIQKVTVFPRVCKRWQRICRKGILWNVIDIPPSCTTSRSITKLLKLYAGPFTKVLRIRTYPQEDRPKKKHPNPITENTWEFILKSCPKLVELYIEATDISNLKNMWLLPSSICRIFIIDCYNSHEEKGLMQLLTNSVRHPNLELLSSTNTELFVANPQDLRIFSKNKTIKYLGLSKNLKTFCGLNIQRSLREMTQLTHLDISGGAKGLYHDDLNGILRLLVNLEKVDISDNVIDTISRTDFGEIWKEIWDHELPQLKVVKICLVSFRNISKSVTGRICQLKSLFTDRFDLKVINCKITKRMDHMKCEVVSLLPPPITLIPL